MFPKPPSQDIDWDFVGLQGLDQTSHIESTYSVDTEQWSRPQLVRDPMVAVHGLAPGLNYGQQCYEGMRACRSKDNKIFVFRPHWHAKRMAHSAAMVSIPPVPEQVFLDCIYAAVRENSEFVPPHGRNSLLYIRPLLFGSSAQLMLAPPSEFKFCVFVQPGTALYGDDAVDAVVLDDFDRAAPRGVGHAKVGGNYAPVIRWSQKALEDGYVLTLHLDAATHTEIDEFSSCAFAGIKAGVEGVSLVVPNGASAIESVTADSCMAIAKDLGWKVERRAVKWAEVSSFDEVLAVGTATMILPVRSIVRPLTKEVIEFCSTDDEPGIYGQQLRAKLSDIAYGVVTNSRDWLVEVHSHRDQDIIAPVGIVKARL